MQMQILTGIDQENYSRIEAGQRFLTLEQLSYIALVLNVSMDYLAGLTDEQKPYPRTETVSFDKPY